MAFVKLDTGILDSTLWLERELREVFVTALLMAEPREFREPIAELQTRATKPTGWQIPPGWYGFVKAAGPGIVHRSLVPMSAGMVALEKLSTGDAESRSNAFGGRRMVRVDGGFVILNYMKYREKDHTAAERSRRYRERKAEREAPGNPQGNPQIPSRCSATPDHRDITQAEAEADISNPPSPLPPVDNFSPAERRTARIIAQGKARGIEPKPGESMEAFTQRVEHGEAPAATPKPAAQSLEAAKRAIEAGKAALQDRTPMPETLKAAIRQ